MVTRMVYCPGCNKLFREKELKKVDGGYYCEKCASDIESMEDI